MLHEAYCVRHMYKCKCGDVVCKAEKDDHEEEKHVSIKCKHCSFEAMKHEFGNHEETCDRKPKECQFCEQMIQFANFFDHVNFCGSKTRLCEFCHRNVMLRNQKYHEKEECAKFLREEYEKKEQEKVKQLEEEERQKDKINELQRKRRQMKEEKERKEKEEQERAREAAKPKPKPTGYSGATRSKDLPEKKRALPDYYGGAPASKPSGVASKPSAIAGRTRAKEKPVEEKKPVVAAKPLDSYKSKLRNRRGEPTYKEEQKELASKPAPIASKRPAGGDKFSSYSRDVEMTDANVLDEIPAELLNQIYSEDLDQHDVESLQSQEYGGLNKPVRVEAPVAERLIGGDMDVDHRRPARVENRPRRVSPPPAQHSNPDHHIGIGGAEENENELIQKAIAASLQEHNPRRYPMGKLIG